MTVTKQQTRLTCPNCKAISLARLEPSLTRPLLPVGFCDMSCSRCNYRGALETELWREAQRVEVRL
jgi:C4-type Zn-finger protein